ncbi:MAG TPA: hypothetical protein VJ697_03440, partial [Nitrososphaeraceae archaeon]|nr:hypothetical protein [Nitrososphaeraceae archaeon]
KEALEYIKNKFSKSISRRAYYNYKNKVYEERDKNSPYSGLYRFHESKQRSKDLTSLSMISHREHIIQDGLLNRNITSRNEFSKLDNTQISLKKMREKAIFLIKESEKVLVKINSKTQTANRNFKVIPQNATIREEYVKCGKDFCLRCKHGPYYYAYWRDEKGKLKKKYIGRNDPSEKTGKEIQDNFHNNNDLENILRNNQNALEAVFNNKVFSASP